MGTAYDACVGFVVPQPEVCDATMVDEDCDGLINEDGSSCICGDGFISGVEQCDDGNTVDDDGCSNSYRLPACGDEVRSGTEEFDGNGDNGDGCTNQCRNPRCGDGFVLFGVEQCDDGNVNDLDGRTNDCKLAKCGDGKDRRRAMTIFRPLLHR